MQLPLEVSFRGLPRSEDIETLIRREADKLHRFCDNLISCRVAVEQPNQRQRSGNPFRIRIEVTLPPGKRLVVTRNPRAPDPHDKLPTLIRRAFDAMERRLKEATEKRRGDVKSREEPTALVALLFPGPGYGFLRTTEGREVFFHRNSVLHNGFDRLAVGTEVRFVETMGEMGPQATTVVIVNKPGVRSSAGRIRARDPVTGRGS